MSAKVHLITMGCPKNDVDSEVISRILIDSDNTIENDPDDASMVFINTCGFIEDAKKESIEQIADAVKKKRTGKIEKVIIAGCLVKRCREELESEFNDVDAFFSVSDFASIRRYFNLPCWESNLFSRYRLTPAHYSYLKIAEGCDYQCSFCTIPSIRGLMRSRPLASLLEEAQKLADNGVRELIIIAEDTTRYGKDLQSNEDLCTLLMKLAAIQGFRWIRLLYAFPKSISDRLIDVIGNSEKICNYIDMPLQHISDTVLERMNRTYKRKYIERLIEKLRVKIPGIILRTTAIVGFPGETREQFVELSDFLTDVEFERLGVFMYSDEKGTAASELDEKVEHSEIVERYEEIRLNQDLISERNNKQLLGKSIEVLIDSEDEETGKYIGRTYGDAPAIDQIVRINRSAYTGEFTTITVEQASAYEIYGK
ncbi:hypothetical protein AMJ80_00300 [bacterium SM23_31]|nr:MAG: hypothetical protein AMJ80_00300 [bacterium SM23_31]